MTFAPSEDPDQPRHPPGLIRSLCCPQDETLGPQLPPRALQRLWSDWVDAQADLSLRWVHRSVWRFCHEAAQLLLAHLRRRLTRWAYSIAMVRRPSVFVVVHTFKPVYLWSQLANLDQILCVASLEWGKGCIRSWGRLDQNSGFHGNRKPPLTCNGKNDVSTFSRLFLIGSFLYLQVARTCIKSRTSSNFHQIGPLTTELAALERLKNFP